MLSIIFYFKCQKLEVPVLTSPNDKLIVRIVDNYPYE